MGPPAFEGGDLNRFGGQKEFTVKAPCTPLCKEVGRRVGKGARGRCIRAVTRCACPVARRILGGSYPTANAAG